MRLVLLLALLCGPPGLRAQSTHALIVSGVSGEPRLAQQFQRDALALKDAVERRYGGTAVLLSERSAPRSDRTAIASAFAALARDTKPGDHVLITLIGHGSAQGGEARFNVPGPDVTAADLASWLVPLKGRALAVIVATSASGAFLSALSAPGRTIVTATRSAAEHEEVVFPRYFAQALSDDVADTNKDGGVSIAEAYEYAKREVARYYQTANRLATEHALLDDQDDGALRFVLRAGGTSVANAETQAIQQRIDALKARKAAMSAEAYEAELEKLLLELARKSRELREGKKP